MDDSDEAYVLLLLSDSNLPTGSFVASAGLESYMTHGFASQSDPTIAFIRDNLASYGHSALPFVSDAHRVVARFKSSIENSNFNEGSMVGICSVEKCDAQWADGQLMALDDLYDTMTLNHVGKRASKAQGVALLTLHSKGLSRPPGMSATPDGEAQDMEAKINSLLNEFKLRVRKDETHGHLPVCWGALTAALGLSLERSQYLHMFLHARSLLSASVRLNDIGPYGAQQLLLHAVRPVVAAETSRCKDLRSGLLEAPEFDRAVHGAANTWPLGEILSARHDLQHSRIFNS